VSSARVFPSFSASFKTTGALTIFDGDQSFSSHHRIPPRGRIRPVDAADDPYAPAVLRRAKAVEVAELRELLEAVAQDLEALVARRPELAPVLALRTQRLRRRLFNCGSGQGWESAMGSDPPRDQEIPGER
jgi:hypothetical protein